MSRGSAARVTRVVPPSHGSKTEDGRTVLHIGPQPGPQTAFLATKADIAIYGGAAGSGKTFGLLLEPLRHIIGPLAIDGFSAVIFRRVYPEIKNEGGLWDESMRLYPRVGGAPVVGELEWRWYHRRTAAVTNTVRFAHLQHETSKLDWQGAAIPLMEFDELTHFCLTPDHDVLTEGGWVPIAEVISGDRVASLTPEREIIFATVAEAPAFDYNGPLIIVEQRQGVSLAMTPNHRCVVDRQDDAGSWGFVTADHLSRTNQCLPRTGTWRGTDGPSRIMFAAPTGRGHGRNANNAAAGVAMDDYLGLLGWFLSEGSAFHARRKWNGSPCVSIRQTKPCAALDALVARLPWRARADGDGGWRIFSRQLYEHFAPLGDLYQKRIPRWVFALPPARLRLLWDAFVEGDGHRVPNGGIQFGLANKGLRDDLQELALRLGLVATCRDGWDWTKRYRVYTLGVSRPTRHTTRVKPESVRRVQYCGKVHCLTVPSTGTFLVRRNGRACWTGNSAATFFYMVSRNRPPTMADGTKLRIRPYLRASTNPDADSWVAEFLAWWIDPNTGFPIPERSGVLRYFVRVGNEIVWGDTREELARHIPPDALIDADTGEPLELRDLIKSVTFIPGKLSDNKELTRRDPTYYGSLLALPLVERERLLGGNWKIKAEGGKVFNRAWFGLPIRAPGGRVGGADVRTVRVRYWDKAATDAAGDWTVGVRMAKVPRDDGKYYYVVEDVVRGQWSSGERKVIMKQTALSDGKGTKIRMEEEGGSSGKDSSADDIALLVGYDVRASRVTGDKATRADAYSAQVQGGNVKLVEAPAWNETYLQELHAFPTKGVPDDQVDASSGAFNFLHLHQPPKLPGTTSTTNLRP